MKFSAALALIVFVGLVANSSAWPARKRMVYLAQQQPQYYGGPQRMMYVHQYVQPSHTHARSTQAAEVLVAGESVATGTYLNDCDHSEAEIAVAGLSEQQQHGEDALGAAGEHDVHAVAEADNEVEGPVADAQVSGGVSVNVATDVALDVPADVAAADDDDAAAAVDAVAAAVEGAVGAEAAIGAEESVAVEGGASGEGVAVDVSAAVDGAPAVEAEVENHEAKEARDYNFEAAEAAAAGAAEVEVAAAEEPAVSVDVAAELPAPEPIAPVAPVAPAAPAPAAPAAVPVAKPARRYLPSHKKVYVELEQSADSDDAVVHDDDDDEDDEEVAATPVKPVRVPNGRRPNKKAAQSAGARPTKAPLPAGSFFPIDFGGTSGGAIAIANSFSTGEGGSATSHAIAYGSPDAARSRSRPSKLH